MPNALRSTANSAKKKQKSHRKQKNPTRDDYQCVNSYFTDLWWLFHQWVVASRGGVEDTKLEAKAKDTKKSDAKAKDSLFENRTSRGQGQECSRPRPRTEDTGASALQKKKVFKNIVQAISNSMAYPEFLIAGGLNHKSHEMTSSKVFQRESTCGTKIS